MLVARDCRWLLALVGTKPASDGREAGDDHVGGLRGALSLVLALSLPETIPAAMIFQQRSVRWCRLSRAGIDDAVPDQWLISRPSAKTL
jgi:hypothetical protein